jgi:exodeoxyribonuclease-5
MLKVHRIRKTETMYGARFATIEVSMVDYPELERFESIVFLETLSVEEPHLSRERLKALFFEIEKDFTHIQNKQKRYAEIMKSPYFNALQVKYAYAITCHKSQGGQWNTVFVDHGFLGKEKPDLSFYRWLYTAFTRASEQLYAVNLLPELIAD